MHAAVYYFKSECFVGDLRAGIIDQYVRGHLNTAMGAGPGLGGSHQLSANALIAGWFFYKPAFHVTDRAYRIAPVRMRSEIDFEESSYCALVIAGNQSCAGQECGGYIPERCVDLPEVIVIGCIRPERSPHVCQGDPIRGLR